MEQARNILNKALAVRMDARAYVWLSATTQDPLEQRKYLECAVAADPSNAMARRGLVMLSEKLDRQRVLAEGEGVLPRQPAEPEEAENRAFLCPKCGGHMVFSVENNMLTCQNCGTVRAIPGQDAPSNPYASPVADQAEQAMDFVLPTARAHRWAEAQQRVSCQQCGAVILLPPGPLADQCPYCGSNRIITASEAVELLDPQVIGVMKIDAKQARQIFKKWLGKGLFAPDDLASGARAVKLLPAYYPFWTFDGTIEVPWSCDVNEGSDRNPRWVSRNGTEIQFFDDVLVPGLRAMKPGELASIEPFKLKELAEFMPEYLAGWPALNYDLPMADASLAGREKVIRKLRTNSSSFVEPGRQKRNIRLGGGRWSGMTYKYVLLPLWVGVYQYNGKPYKLLINGQTGKIGGQKPHDNIKIGMAVVFVALLLLLSFAVAWWLTNGGVQSLQQMLDSLLGL